MTYIAYDENENTEIELVEKEILISETTHFILQTKEGIDVIDANLHKPANTIQFKGCSAMPVFIDGRGYHVKYVEDEI